MVSVKGSKQSRMVVVPYQPMRQIVTTLILAMLVAFACVASFYWGHLQGLGEQSQAIVERDQLLVERVDTTRKGQESYQQIANLELAARVDQSAEEQLRQQVVVLKQELAEVEERVSFYRGLMSPNEAGKKISIGNVSVKATDIERRYTYKVVVQQIAAKHAVISGAMRVNIIGHNADNAVLSVPLYQLSEQIENEDIRLRFKYFQNIEGEIILPEGFMAKEIEVVVTSSGKKPAKVEKRVGWPVEVF